MSDAVEQLNELRGKPVEIVLGGEKIIVRRMTIDAQLTVLEGFSNVAGKEENIKLQFETMVKVLSQATGKTEEEIKTTATVVEVIDAFPIIWRQNEFDFLLEKVRTLGEQLKPR